MTTPLNTTRDEVLIAIQWKEYVQYPPLMMGDAKKRNKKK
jgi:hypothetical protein